MSRDVLKRLSDANVVALCVAGEDWPRSLLSGTVIPDAWMGLLLKGDRTRKFVPAGDDPRPGGDDKLVLVRTRAVSVTLSVSDRAASCGNAVSGACEVQVRWDARDDDLAAMHRTLLAGPELTNDRLAKEFADAGGQTALHDFISATPAARLVREDVRTELGDALREALKRFLFDSGMVIDRVAGLELTSADLARREDRERSTAEHVERIKTRDTLEQAALAATTRRLDDLGGIMEKLKAASAGDENARWHQLLPALSPAERGRLLENLWRISPDRRTAAAIVAVSGDECLWLDPADPERISQRVSLTEELGGLRSVSYSPERDWLLVGAALGVWAVDATSGAIAAKFSVPDAKSPRTGFNSAVTLGERLYATSSEFGCWSWSLEDPTDAEPILVPEGGVPQRIRAAVATDDNRLLFAADDCVHVLEPQSGDLGVLSAADDTIHCMTALDKTLFVGAGGGKLFRVDIDHPDDWWLVQQFPATIESVEARRWSDLVELVVPAGSRGVSGIYADQHVVTHLLESTTPIRRAWASDDVVVGLNQLRDRLVVMNANLPERTGREARIARMTSQSIQDACIVTKASTESPSAA